VGVGDEDVYLGGGGWGGGGGGGRGAWRDLLTG